MFKSGVRVFFRGRAFLVLPKMTLWAGDAFQKRGMPVGGAYLNNGVASLPNSEAGENGSCRRAVLTGVSDISFTYVLSFVLRFGGNRLTDS